MTALRASILDKISDDPPRGLRMPLASNHTAAGESCTPEHVQINDKRLTDDEKAALTAFLQRTDLQDYEDTTPRLSAPVVPELADAVAYTSTQFEVLNDGFLEHPDGGDDGYMEEYGYDERDYDQMEDDWFCIRFDPARTEPGYLTGAQVETDSGQIYLNAQLVIDTSGGSAAAWAAAEERGEDWYRCDAGLGFSGRRPPVADRARRRGRRAPRGDGAAVRARLDARGSAPTSTPTTTPRSSTASSRTA